MYLGIDVGTSGIKAVIIDTEGKVVDVTAGAPSKDEMEALIKKTIAAGA